MHIEMAFGFGAAKMKKPLHIKLKHIKTTMMKIARLHNFCISAELWKKAKFLRGTKLEQA